MNTLYVTRTTTPRINKTTGLQSVSKKGHKLFDTTVDRTLTPLNDDSVCVTIDSPYINWSSEKLISENSMSISRHVYRNICEDSSVDESDRTKVFSSIMIKLGMTQHGCYTYTLTMRKMMRGEEGYQSNKTYNNKIAKEKREALLRSESDFNRWGVVDKDTNLSVAFFLTRTDAQTFNKTFREVGVNTKWIDTKKSA